MAKVTVHDAKTGPTPTQQVAQSANLTTAAIDTRGRRITVRSLSFLEQYRLSKVLGENAKNETTMSMAIATASVRDIDGDAILFPGKESELEFIMQRLDSDGFSAVFEAMKQMNDEQGPDAAKN